MLRSLFTAGQGMIAQQMNVDVISNNLANVSTTGFKKERVEFKDLLYETLSKSYMANDSGKPVNLQVGHGVTPVATVKSYAMGNLEKTDNPMDFALDGQGFFMVKGPKGDVNYTKDGSFKLSITEDGQKITTSDGYAVLDPDGQEIPINGVSPTELIVSQSGELSRLNKETGDVESLGKKIGVVKFANRYGLEDLGNNLVGATTASGKPVADSEVGEKTIINQNFLEASNVQVVDEMVKLIIAQRAYEINSKSIQTSDEMLNTANNLKR